MRDSISSDHLHPEQPLTWSSRVGVTGIAFFLLKGLLWLLAPILFAFMR
jgi:hypothetical protein